MILPAQHIRQRCLQHALISPFHERTIAFGKSFGLSSAGYDVRIKQKVVLMPGEHLLASTLEKFSMPLDLVGKPSDKSSWIRDGLRLGRTIIEPGWRGYLTLELSNVSKNILRIPEGAPICQILFELLCEPTEQPYPEDGKYQDQADEPVPARYEQPCDKVA